MAEHTIDALLTELASSSTTHQRRLQIGNRLDEMGDSRLGVGCQDGVPALAWLTIREGGTVEIMRSTHTEPVARLAVQPFYISKYLVTFDQYQTFVEAENGLDKRPFPWGMQSKRSMQTAANLG